MRHPVSPHTCEGPAPPPTTARSFHTVTPNQTPKGRARAAVLDAGHQGGQVLYVDDSTSEHPSAVGTNVPRASQKIRGENPGGCVLLRKEVIQPHLPVRLPCYDFVPIASPTFDHSLPCHKGEGLGHGLRVLPTFVT